MPYFWIKEIAVLEGYEALRNVKTLDIEVTTPIEKSIQPTVDTKKLCFVPILRAGLGMVDGILELVPNAKVGHLGLYRDEETHQPVEYFTKLPKSIAKLPIQRP